MVSTGELKAISIQPGINKNNTRYLNEGAYVSAQWIRFNYGNPQKMGGWQSAPTSVAYEGYARDSLAWSDLRGEPLLALGTNVGLFVYNGQSYADITPVRLSVAAVSVFSTFLDSRSVKVSVNSHGAIMGDRFVVETSTIADGLGLLGTYTITSAATNTFRFDAASSATSTTTGQGAATTLSFLIPTGPASAGAIGGWGSGPWGGSGGGWGASVSTLVADLRTWTLDTWGEDLMANYRGGPIYYWDRSAGFGQRAYQVTGAPTKVNSITVLSPPRILVAYGVSGFASDFDPLLVRWSDQEDYTNWTPAVTNASGELRVQKGNFLERGVATKAETLVFTDEGVYKQTYIGGDFVYAIDRIGDNCGLIGLQAAIDVNGLVYWMSNSGFFVYNGTVTRLECSLHDNIFDTNDGDGINYDQKEKISCGVNQEFSEIIWFYPSRDSQENDRYVIYNYARDVWYDGVIVRTTWIDANTFSRPIATGEPGTTYYQEVGLNGDNLAIDCRLDTALFDLEDGSQILFVDQYIPDYKDLQGANSVTFTFKKFPQSAEEVTKGPFPVNVPTVYMRGRGRQAAISYRGTGLNTYFELGKPRLRARPDGQR